VHGKNWRQKKSKERHKAMNEFLRPKNERGIYTND
jgi:hypothetical protein